ncbi:MAG: bifunctional [glutamine synthetase] adenylyltransferase/[glutamine synthetase]-adenylyl-L-tyrosine phosphorylase [Bauldia sp.]|nr:bifunctional [glutamine synthetase] adenylyltransferase/[glutamine synthetase]-adenylyl-L-tyrosine phosphorylase [Bauldia sp.]
MSPRTAAGVPLSERLGTALPVATKAAVAAQLAALVAAAPANAAVKAAVTGTRSGALVGGAMAGSSFLRGLILDDPARLVRLLGADPDAAAGRLIAATALAWRGADEEGVMAALRTHRNEFALLVALADLGGVWTVDRVMEALTAFADAAVGAATAWLLRREHDAGTLVLPNPEDPGRASGWVILAMGKQGAGELNYSSDIDLITLFDPSAATLAPATEPTRLYVRMTRRLVHILQERTADGYVFRIDLRLRPDPGSTAVAIATEAALLYYESQGQNWERAALIKARAVAGDIAAGEQFLARLAPFLWRKYLDYAAIADIHSIKRQIHDFRGHETIAVAGHNLKLGRGGIREIEFFVQTQQLIFGGRSMELRGRRTLDMLDELAAEHWIAPEAATELAEAYRFLRRLEHRIQMVADEQTHTLPAEPGPLAGLARLSGYRGVPDLAKALVPRLETVQRHYARLFENAPTLSTATGSLVFTGNDEDPETVATLGRLGFADPAGVSRTIRGWHHGRYAAMRSASARERLTEITPALLDALAGTENADAAFLAFDRFLSHLPAGLQLFALMASNPRLLDLLARILGTAPRLAEIVTRRPHVLDGILTPAFFGTVPDRKTLAPRLEATLGLAVSYEDALDRARIFGQEQAFLIGVRILAGAIDAPRAGRAYTELAELLVGAALHLAGEQLAEAHGRMPGGKVALVAMGRLGGREMTASSDLDLIILYDVPSNVAGSAGPRSLPPAQYYTRLTQRLVAAISAPTSEGRLYEVDFRLRPSGNSGPLATSLDAFTTYQAKDAWTWEHMALTRARPVAGDAAMMKKAMKAIESALCRPRNAAKVVADVLEMRALVEAEKGGGAWDLKQAPGGMVDVEFIAQSLELRHGVEHPSIVTVETEAVLRACAAAGVLSVRDAEILLPAIRLYQNLNQVLRLCIEGTFRPAEAPGGLREFLAVTGEMPDFARLEAHLVATETAVRATFERLIGKVRPAKK